MLEAKDHIRHLHMANPQGRVFPLTWEEFDYAPFFAKLRQIGYTGRISIEASSKDIPAEGAAGDCAAAASLQRAAGVARSTRGTEGTEGTEKIRHEGTKRTKTHGEIRARSSVASRELVARRPWPA